MNIEVVKMMLAGKGIEIDSALNGKEAIELIKHRFELVHANQGRMYRLILLDYSMPEMDGPECSREIKKLFYQSSVFLVEQKPFICCCTAYSGT